MCASEITSEQCFQLELSIGKYVCYKLLSQELYKLIEKADDRSGI